MTEKYPHVPHYPDWKLSKKHNNCQYLTQLNHSCYAILVREIFGNMYGLYKFTVAIQKQYMPDYSEGFPVYKAVSAFEYNVPIELKMLYTLDEVDACVREMQEHLPVYCMEEIL